MRLGFAAAIVQIMVIDLVFSLDSIITAVGMVDEIEIMIAAVVASVGADDAVRRRRSAASSPSIRRSRCSRSRSWSSSASSSIAEGFDQHVPKGYIYFAMAFSVMRRDAQHPDAAARGTPAAAAEAAAEQGARVDEAR